MPIGEVGKRCDRKHNNNEIQIANKFAKMFIIARMKKRLKLF